MDPALQHDPPVRSVHNSTGQSPSKVLFGRELRLPCDVFGSPTGQSTNIENYVDELQERLLNIWMFNTFWTTFWILWNSNFPFWKFESS